MAAAFRCLYRQVVCRLCCLCCPRADSGQRGQIDRPAASDRLQIFAVYKDDREDYVTGRKSKVRDIRKANICDEEKKNECVENRVVKRKIDGESNTVNEGKLRETDRSNETRKKETVCRKDIHKAKKINNLEREPTRGAVYNREGVTCERACEIVRRREAVRYPG